MGNWDRGGARHLLMRLGMGFVLSWFGVQELRNPSEWAVFVPPFVSDLSPLAINDLILLHGFLLLLAAAAIVLGLLYLPGCLLAMGLLFDIIFGLWLDAGLSDLVIRDLGLLALAGALALDPVRFWRLETVLPKLPTPSRAARRRSKSANAPLTPQPLWLAQASGGAALVAAVLVLAFLLHATGSGADAPPEGALASLASSTKAGSPSPGSTPAAGATPAPPILAATSIRFDSWQYKQYSYQVYPGVISADAKKALAGYELTVQDQSSSVLLKLKALSSRYRDSQITIDKADTAYFVETSMRDDPNDHENNARDDGIIGVNPQGYILQS